MSEPTPAGGRRAGLTIDLGGQCAKLAQGGVTAKMLARGRRRMKELAGKTAFVTGAASGIGLGIATAFAQAGAKVMVCDIEDAALSAALKQLRLTNVDVDGVKADVSLKAELAAAAEATTARYGKVHILVNNAGVGGGGPYGAWTEAAWNWLWAST